MEFLHVLFLHAYFLLVPAQQKTDWGRFLNRNVTLQYSGNNSGFKSTGGSFKNDISGEAANTISGAKWKSMANSFVNDEKLKWSNGIVYYEFEKNVSEEATFSHEEKMLIISAMALIASVTKDCIRFVEKTNDFVTDYVIIIRGDGCYSHVGRQNGSQIISLTKGCLQHLGEVEHELMHALGFYHEMSRPDRDEHITIKWDNIQNVGRNDFEKKPESNMLSLKYDYDSVMHYKWNDFAKNPSLATILTKQPNKLIGLRDNLSPLDIIRLNRAYNCSRYIPVKILNVTDEKFDVILGQGTTLRKLEVNKNLFYGSGAEVEKLFEEKDIPIESVAVDCVERFIYWCSGSVIRKVHLHGGDAHVVVWHLHPNRGISQVRLLAVDHISRQIFWADTMDHNIRVVDLSDSPTAKIVVQCDFLPHALAVSPVRGALYWYDWSPKDKRIATSDIYGANVRVLVSTNIDGVQTLAIDFETDELCWIRTTDGTDEIECLNTDENVRRKVFYESTSGYRFTGLIFHEYMIYWTGGVALHAIRRNTTNEKSAVIRVNEIGINAFGPINSFAVISGKCSSITYDYKLRSLANTFPHQTSSAKSLQSHEIWILIYITAIVLIYWILTRI